MMVQTDRNMYEQSWDILTVYINILYVLYKGAFFGDKNLSVIKMHGATLKINIHIVNE
jgi:hypothetical protein